jgi:hypothetical protein
MKLKLESINQNQETKVSFTIEFLEKKLEQDQEWQYYRVKLQNGNESYCFDSINKKTTSAVGTIAEVGKFAFAVKPHNELDAFQKSFTNFSNSEKQSFRFEPSDPSFELIIERLPIINDEHNFKVYFWVDAGNTKALEYTWDSIGVRFICSKECLNSFFE